MKALLRLARAPHLMLAGVLAASLAVEWRRGEILSQPIRVMTLVVLAAIPLHCLFADTGWFYRYEAYLLVALLVALCLQSDELRAQCRMSRGLAVLTVLTMVVLSGRALMAFGETPNAMFERYAEHVLSAEFVAEYYPGAPVAVNDAGAMSFFTTSKVLDVFGLGSMEPIRFRREADGYGKDDLEAWARREGVRVAVIQVEWDEATSRIPDGWQLVGMMKAQQDVIFGDTRVGFFAPGPREAEELAAKLPRLWERLPDNIEFGLASERPGAAEARQVEP